MKIRKHTLIRNLVCVLIRNYRFRMNPKNIEQIVLMEQYRLMIGFTWVFCILLAFTSCRTTKDSTKTALKTELAAKLDVAATNETNVATVTDAVVKDNSTITDDVAEVVTATVWSAPDSIGKQYIAKTTVTERVRRRNSVANLKTHVKSEAKTGTKAALRDQSDYKSDSKATSNVESERKTETPAWLIAVVLVLLIGFLVFVGRLVVNRLE